MQNDGDVSDNVPFTHGVGNSLAQRGVRLRKVKPTPELP